MNAKLAEARAEARDRARFALINLNAAKRIALENPEDDLAVTNLEAAIKEAQAALAVGRELGL